MAERLTLNLRRNLDYVETNGMPRWTQDGLYPVDSLPSTERFTPGRDALVWTERGNERFVYVGLVRNLRIEGQALRFDKFELLARPVVLVDDGVNSTETFYDGAKGFMNDFSYISEVAFERALANSMRSAAD